MGLRMSYSTVRNRGGAVKVDLSIDETAFKIYLPDHERDTVKEKPKNDDRYSLNGKRVLVVDDEEVIRDVTGRILKHMGASDILFAEEGQKALEIYRECAEKQEPVDVVIMDLTIPGHIGGKGAIEELQKLDPKVKAIVSSGYASAPILSNYRKFGFKGALVKPYKIEELKEILKDVLSIAD